MEEEEDINTMHLLPLYILAAYQTFITHSDLQIYSMLAYNSAITTAYLASLFYPIRYRWEKSPFLLKELGCIYHYIIPCTVLLSLGYVDNIIGMGIIVIFLHFVLKDFMYKFLLVLGFFVVNIFTFPQLSLTQKTLAIDTKYNYEVTFIVINTLCFVALSWCSTSWYSVSGVQQDISLSQLSQFFYMPIILISRQWITDTTTEIPLVLNWFNSEDYDHFWPRVIMMLGLLNTLPADYNLQRFMLCFSVSSAIGVALALLGGPTVFLIFATALRLCLYSIPYFLNV